MKKAIYISLFLLLIVTIVPVYNAVTSIVTGMSMITILFLAYKKNDLNVKKIPKLVYSALAIFILGITISSFGINDKESIKESIKMLYWMLPFFLLYLLCICANTDCLKKITVFTFNLGLFITTIPAVIEFLHTHNRVSSLYGNPNHFASMLDIILPFSIMINLYYIHKKRNKFIVTVMIINLLIASAATCFSGSRGSWLGLIIGFYLLINLYGFVKVNLVKMFQITLISFLLSSSLIYTISNDLEKNFSRSYDHERILLLKSSYAMWNDNKVFGVGLKNWADNYHNKYILPEAKEPYLDMPHNIYAYYFSTTGIIGGFSFIIMLVLISVFLMRKMSIDLFGGACAMAMLWAVFAISIHGLVDVGLTLKFASRLFYGCLGLTVAAIIKESIKGEL